MFVVGHDFVVPASEFFNSVEIGYDWIVSRLRPEQPPDALLGSSSPDGRPGQTLRIAASGDIHCRDARRAELEQAFADLDGKVDLVLLAGDLTTHGDPEEAAILTELCGGLRLPTVAVLGNHDWHAGHHEEIVEIMRRGGVTVLERDSTICCVNDMEIGVVATKGFVGGFPGSHLPDFGEPLLRSVYAETSAEIEALDRGLRDVSHCPVRIVLLHYSPTDTTLAGEPEGIWAFLGTDRMAAPILEHSPDLVLHGHAHAGRLEGSIGDVPVFNVSVPVIGRDFWTFELSGVDKTLTPIH
jgi:Icc-related predicted phosphoesterase